MDINQARLKQNIARIRRDIRKTSREMQALLDAELDCTGAARVLVHLQNDLRLYLEKLECGIQRGEGSHPAPTSRPGEAS
ncbi:hypothetical protein GGQ85_003669 [Nitrobacter vulgaris]|uniref:hypothetical protein n=1 Tax=Nitrobacter vulgaris TaxID=29421 RepID=UPI00286360F7|nr:hypothetical protein [Nitrobacter vulgaris]MDR6305942.1 hypothetical protein [Nitrobacter vulgaris]